MIKWKASYETKIVKMDEEHQQLVKQINLLYEAVRGNRTEEVMMSLFDQLIEYTDQHFSNEEALMEKHNYPGLQEQRAQHQQLTADVREYRKRLLAGEQLPTKEVMGFLRNWLLEHIVEYDLKYGPYIDSRAGRFAD